MGTNGSQIKSLKKEGKIPRVYLQNLLWTCRPLEAVLLESLLVEDESVSIPKEDLHHRASAVAECKQVPGEGIELKSALDEHGKAVDLLSHVRISYGQVDPNI